MVQSYGRSLLRTEQLSIEGFDNHEINFSLSPGSRIGILGGQGSGKTGLLRALARLDQVKTGKLFWGDADVSRKILWRMKKKQPYVSLLLANPYTLFDHKVHAGDLLHDIEQTKNETTHALLQEKALPVSAADMPIESLSGVMRVRLGLIRMKHNHSPVVLIDDIFRFLVPEVWKSTCQAIMELADSQQALVIASRSYECLQSLDFILVLHKGWFVEGGPREAVFSNPSHPITQDLFKGRERTTAHDTATTKFESPANKVTASNEAISISPGHWVFPS